MSNPLTSKLRLYLGRQNSNRGDPEGTMSAGVGGFSLVGQDVNFKRGLIFDAETAQTYALTGIDASLLRGYPLTADVQTYVLTGIDATLDPGGGPVADGILFENDDFMLMENGDYAVLE